MRRSEKEITDKDEIHEILKANTVCRLAMADGTTPYVVPMNYGYHYGKLFFHSAPEGRKMDILRRTDMVCFEVSDSFEIVPGDTACKHGTRYRSIIGYGRIRFVESADRKLGVLKEIMAHITGQSDWDFSVSELERVVVFELKIDSVSGKRSG